MDHRISVGLSVYNVLDIRNEVDVWPLTGKAGNPGAYYTDRVGYQILNIIYLVHIMIVLEIFTT